MITGKVTSDNDAVIHLIVSGPSGSEHQTKSVVDTGFSGFLTLPRAVIRKLSLIRRGSVRTLLGDGSERTVEPFTAMVEWGGEPHRIEIERLPPSEQA